MMKKVLLFVVFLVIITFFSCSSETKTEEEGTDSDPVLSSDQEHEVNDTDEKKSPDEKTETGDDSPVYHDDAPEIPDHETDDDDYEIEYPDIDMNDYTAYNGTYGWEIMREGYPFNNTWDVLSFEWDYFMIHNDDDSFSGSIGYLIANPREKDIAFGLMGKLVPGGGNIAIAGEFDKDLPPVADYENFDPEYGHTFEASGTERSMYVENKDNGYWGKMTPDEGNNSILLEGQTGNFEWEVTVTQDWPILNNGAETFKRGTDDKIDTAVMGVPAAQVWNVHMFWPRTRVVGWIRDLRKDKTYPIDGHGYRENAWGRWAFNQGGWDFGTCSDSKSKVMFGWQSYHYKTQTLDYVDLGFIEDGEYKLVHFRADRGELGWKHETWSFDPEARQCLPRDTKIIAKNNEYKVVTNVYIGQGQVAMLSDATDVTKNYFIMIQIPWFEGTITRLSDNRKIAEFSGRGGGEFATQRAPEGTTFISDEDCKAWGQSRYFSPFPE